MRDSAPFLDAIIAYENASGIHIAACEKTFGAGTDAENKIVFAFEFNRQAGDLQVYQLHERRNGWVATVLKDEEDGACREHGEAAADALIDYSEKPLPGQEWVKIIAERRAFEIA